MKKTLLTLVGLAAFSLAGVNAQIVINNSTDFTYSQDFDSLLRVGINTWEDNVTLLGWYSNRTTYNSSNGSNDAGALYSLGPNGNADRALGAISSDSVSPIFGAIFVNNSGGSISLVDINLSFVGEQWRVASNAQTLAFSYQISNDAPSIDSGTYTANTNLDFTAPQSGGTPGNINGNDAANQVTFTEVSLDSSGILGNNQYLAIRWSKTGTGSPALGVDNFQLTVVPEPSTWALMGLGCAFVLWRIRRKHAARA
jgi:trimeric autotransporter adhesin